MGKFGWAYIGNGNIARSTANDIMKGEHKIVSVYGRNIQKARAFAKNTAQLRLMILIKL